MAEEEKLLDLGAATVEVVLPEGMSFREDQPDPEPAPVAPVKAEDTSAAPAAPVSSPAPPAKPAKPSPNVYQRFLAKSARYTPPPAAETKRPVAAAPAAPPAFGPRLERFRQKIGDLRREAERHLPELAPVFEAFGQEVAALVDDHRGFVEEKHKETDAVLGEVVERYGDVHAAVTAQRRLSRDRMKRQEARAKGQHKDWQDVLQRAGIFEALDEMTPGRFKDPELAFEIYSQEDPAEYAYQFAKDKLKSEGQEPAEEPAPPTAPKAPRAEGIPAEPKGAETPEATERRARAEVAAALAGNEGKPKGIKHLRSAGPGRVQMDRPYLDRLMEEDYPRYLALINANGGKQGTLYRWHHGGF